nr:hypothetical protein GCM10020185_25640 [Pseudomonas brassicacearum subsp. brassicacearum]
MNIAPRAFLGFALIGALMLALGVFALTQMSTIRASGESIARNSVPSIKALDEFTQLTLRLRVLSYRLLTNREPDIQQKTYDLFEQRNQQIRAAQAAYEKLISAPEERAAYDQYVQLLGQYRQLEDRMKTLSRNNQIEDLRALLNTELLSNSEAVNAVLGRLLEINNQQADALNKGGRAPIFKGLQLGCHTAGHRHRPDPVVRLAADQQHHQADCQRAGCRRGNRQGQPDPPDCRRWQRRSRSPAAGDVDHAGKKLRDTLQRISGSATQLASAAEELNAVTDESARGLTQQNNEIEQAATAVNEMTSAVEEVARNAVSTSEASKKTPPPPQAMVATWYRKPSAPSNA